MISTRSNVPPLMVMDVVTAAAPWRLPAGGLHMKIGQPAAPEAPNLFRE